MSGSCGVLALVCWFLINIMKLLVVIWIVFILVENWFICVFCFIWIGIVVSWKLIFWCVKCRLKWIFCFMNGWKRSWLGVMIIFVVIWWLCFGGFFGCLLLKGRVKIVGCGILKMIVMMLMIGGSIFWVGVINWKLRLWKWNSGKWRWN